MSKDVESRASTNRQEAREDSLELFRDPLNIKYGSHGVQFMNSDDTFARMDFRQFGPLEASIVQGRSVPYERSRDKLDGAWHDQIFFIRERTGHSTVDHHGRRLKIKSSDIIVADPRGGCNFILGQDADLTSFNVTRTMFGLLLPSPSLVVGRGINGAIGIGRSFSAIMGSLDADSASYDEQDRTMMIETVVSLLGRVVTRNDTASEKPTYHLSAR